MTIDDRYGLPPLDEAFRVPTGAFPKAVQERLSRALLELPQLWRGMAFDAFRRGGAMYLRVALDLGDRPLYLFVHEDGHSFQFEAPVLFDFPGSASHFVLSELCGSNTYLSFRLDRHRRTADKDGGERETDSEGRVSPMTTEVLYAWGRFEFEAFVDAAAGLVPYLIARLAQAEADLKAFLEGPPPGQQLAA